MDVKKISTKSLIRLLIRELYQIYDCGGISAGRSLRSRFLESTLSLIILPETKNWDLVPGIEQEVERRIKEKQNLRKIYFYRDLRSWNNLSLVFSLISALGWHLEEQERIHPEFYISYAEKKIVSLILGLFVKPESLPFLTSCSLLNEADRRSRLRHEKMKESFYY